MPTEAKKDFCVTLVPVIVASAKESWAQGLEQYITEKTVNSISRIYDSVNNTFLTSTHNNYIYDRIKNSFFCCCYDEGMLMFTFRLTELKTMMTGYFIPRSSVRTAWKVFRSEIIYICAYGAEAAMKKIRTPDAQTLFSMADSCATAMDSEFREVVDKVISDMETASVPYSFAYTRFPLKYIPVMFESRASGSAESADILDSRIVLSSEKTREISSRMKNLVPEAQDIYLCCGSRKDYINIKKEEYKAAAPRSDVKALVKELEAQTAPLKEPIWYFMRRDQSAGYTVLTESVFSDAFSGKDFDFQILPVAVQQAARDINAIKENEKNTANDRVKEDSSSHKKFGFSLFGRKNK